jgi:hypothetical protein
MRWAQDTDLPLSATEILKTKVGDGRHYAVLYAALARTVGIPTRIVVGYSGGYANIDGVFSRHTWAESYVGYWIAVESAGGGTGIDAAHIKLGVSEDISAFADMTDKLLRQELISADVLGYIYLTSDSSGGWKEETWTKPTGSNQSVPK